jgi:hypothetical protein
MWYGYDNIIIPYTIDFRLTEKSVSYGDVKFDRSYSVEQFKGQFPKSSIASLQMPQSFFGMMTGQKGTNFQHFIVSRKSKDNPDAAPLIEFTFENGKLIFILFANF